MEPAHSIFYTPLRVDLPWLLKVSRLFPLLERKSFRSVVKSNAINRLEGDKNESK